MQTNSFKKKASTLDCFRDAKVQKTNFEEEENYRETNIFLKINYK